MVNNLTPFISIIISVLNGKSTLNQCIDSIARQTYINKELIIIDGGSKDGTVKWLEENRNSFSYFISEPDKGIYNAWNKGLAQAKGEWICFLGADDYFWHSQVLEQMAIQLEGLSSSIRVAYGQVMRLGAEGQILFPEGEPWPQAKRLFKHFMSIPHPAVMHRRSLFEHHGKFDESFRIAGDYEFLLRELKENDAVFFPNIIVAGVRTGGISTLSKNTVKSIIEIVRAQRMHEQFRLNRWLLKSIAKEFFRFFIWNFLGDRTAKKLINFSRRIRDSQSY